MDDAPDHPEEIRILTQGRLHKAYRDAGGRVFTLEGDNLDQADSTVYTLAETLVPVAVHLCVRCFQGASE